MWEYIVSRKEQSVQLIVLGTEIRILRLVCVQTVRRICSVQNQVEGG